jgi:hypothetical protein
MSAITAIPAPAMKTNAPGLSRTLRILDVIGALGLRLDQRQASQASTRS